MSVPANVFDFETRRLNGAPMPLAEFRGKVLLLVNTASECGFTPQYEALQELHDRFAPRGFSVIGFPCNQFGGQEPGGAEEIAAFCAKNYGVSFPLSEKIDVNGDNAHPLYRHLTSVAPGILGTEAIKWNFTKFLVDRDGQVVARFAPATKPESIARDIEALL
ncbi:glutathione peroxidase [Aromatoleum aromaticum]|uniref:Glutathione peroxidase n=1 Tax=Aromatoleum aromaticum (strain DSM 19018 / LMG 30748 / EbN1) TaxID=76114 RepID=Q5NYT4_AROAE|nr:glutathione peroxidase [Aromatoleum aromaticum]NMG53307.1 redoxin domain-containing protein [Aromatoleum aromaticum]CAI09780.1 putative glutathione peroxidase protein [Aromatoleum aromaticum EbN1]